MSVFKTVFPEWPKFILCWNSTVFHKYNESKFCGNSSTNETYCQNIKLKLLHTCLKHSIFHERRQIWHKRHGRGRWRGPLAERNGKFDSTSVSPIVRPLARVEPAFFVWGRSPQYIGTVRFLPCRFSAVHAHFISNPSLPCPTNGINLMMHQHLQQFVPLCVCLLKLEKWSRPRCLVLNLQEPTLAGFERNN